MDLQIGTTLHGFTVESSEDVAEFDGTAFLMRHASSGARLLYMRCPDENKAFAITFKTPPDDSTGVFHILEHSVLCGSAKFPVKEPFVNLLKSSMQTFLNAMTFPDKTMYPVASTNEQDLMNLMDVYMDAVLNPNIYRKKEIFEQEGWHYELDGKDAPLRYNGVVFNEMKGALSDPNSVLYNTLCAALFPDTAYAFESGGDPAAIPGLSYEQFLDNHRRHYRPDNSYIMLYGDMQVERQLAFLDEHYLSKFTAPEGMPNPLTRQSPVICTDAVKEMQTAPENACMGLGYVAGEVTDRNRILAVDILVDALLGSNEAPLKRALLDSQIADDVVGYLIDEQLQPLVLVQIKGSKPGAGPAFRTVVESTVEELCQNGIPKERLQASLSRAEFAVRERDFGIADGVVLAMQAMTGWLYDDGLSLAYVQYEEAFKRMHEDISTGYFERLMRGLFLENDHWAMAEVKPVETAGASAEAERLAGVKAAFSDAGLAGIIAEEAELHRLQEAEDSSEDLAKLPLLQLSDIGDMRPEPAFSLIGDAPIPCLYHDIPAHQINYSYHYFDLGRLDFEDLPYVGILMRLLGKLDTAEHSAGELDYLTQSKLGSMRFFAEIYGNEHDPSILAPKMVVSASALSENYRDLVSLPYEVWASTRFCDTGRIKDILAQHRIALEQEFANAGHAAALSRLSTYYAPSSVVREELAGVSFYRFLKGLLADFDARSEELVARLEDVGARLFVKDGLVTSFTGTVKERDRHFAALGRLEIPAAAGASRLSVPDPVKRNEAFIVPTDVCYAAKGYDRRLLDLPYSGTWQVASRVLSLDYLWSEVRVKGGAYGAGFKAERSGSLQFYSYRDPKLDATLASFDRSAEWLSSFEPTEEAMRGYLISSVAGYDEPKKPRALARRQDAEYFSELEPGWRAQSREEVLATDAEAIRALAPAFRRIADAENCCVFGNREIIERSKTDFEVIDLLG